MIPTPRSGGIAIFAGIVLTLLIWAGFGSVVARLAAESAMCCWIPFGEILSDCDSLLPLQLVACFSSLSEWRTIAGIFRGNFGLVASWAWRCSWWRWSASNRVCESALVGWCVSILWILVLTNALNFLDNMDALSAGIGVIASLVFTAIMIELVGTPVWNVAFLLTVLAGALTGFLVWNRPPASIFMGDCGSNVIGFLLATLTIVGTFYDRSGSRHVMLAPLCVLAVPLYDFSTVILIRLSQGRSPFHGDKSHFSHRLVELGLRPASAVLTIHLTTMMTGLAGLLLYKVEDWSGAMLVIGLVICTLAIVAILETVGRTSVNRMQAARQLEQTQSVPETPVIPSGIRESSSKAIP